MIYLRMSSEQVTKKSTQTFIIDNEDIELEAVPQKKKSTKVDINLLMDKVREEKKEKKKNLIFVSLIASVILITGAIASF